ncbi:hypothetical protein C8R44DRAFT_181102 [Mycena epipterygia]|nr:hypothetical protein C8R44DRAFT_181102 [Mycena epipterygia]
MNCECFKTKAYCERNCRCPANCPRRWPGCNSSCSNNTGCRTRKCRCRDNFRECDPELCTACDARDTHVYYPAERRQAIRCENMELQRPEFKHYEIRRSKFGLGAFAAENISRDDVIGEYVGELLDDTGELKHHGVIQRHSGLNYSFDMGFTPVDAQWIGNPTRFLNDSKPRNPNCAADGAASPPL